MKIGTDNQSSRDQWVIHQLSGLESGSRILDAGAGEQQYRKYCENLIYISQDFCEYTGTGDGRGLQPAEWNVSKIDIVSDIVNIPEENESFDAVLCTEVIEHIKNPVSALTEFFRLLKPGGVLILTAPFCSLTHFAPYHFYTGFNSYFFNEVMAYCGFEDINVASNGNYYKYIAQEIRRIPMIAGKYSGSKVVFLWKVLMFPVIAILSFLESHSSGSEELLCYGYHVNARKPTSH
jgi:SAM-dependent methyltransferase